MENNPPIVLKRNSEFLELKKKGRRFWASNWMLLNYRACPGNSISFGTTASRKVGSAVVRNKLKRWCREYFREFSKSENAYGVEINVIFKPIDQGFYKGLQYREFFDILDKGVRAIRKHI